MSTPNSAASSYLAASDFLNRYDARAVGDLVSDNGNRVSPSNLVNNAVLQEALNDASGMIEAACLRSGRYQPTDLSGLTGVSQRFLWRLIADLAMGLLIERRPDIDRPTPKAYDAALAWLGQLATGERIFGLAEVQDAGLPAAQIESPQTVANRNLTTNVLSRFFGRRLNRYSQQE